MNPQKKQKKILFVCMGNICRSPAAEGILKEMASRDPALDLYVESRGIGNWHEGQAPDRRMQEAIKERGIVLTMRAKQIQIDDFDHYDYILAADKEVLNYLYRHAHTPEQKSKIVLMTAFSSVYKDEDVSDPYYEPHRAFEFVLDMLEESCRGLIQHIQK